MLREFLMRPLKLGQFWTRSVVSAASSRTLGNHLTSSSIENSDSAPAQIATNVPPPGDRKIDIDYELYRKIVVGAYAGRPERQILMAFLHYFGVGGLQKDSSIAAYWLSRASEVWPIELQNLMTLLSLETVEWRHIDPRTPDEIAERQGRTKQTRERGRQNPSPEFMDIRDPADGTAASRKSSRPFQRGRTRLSDEEVFFKAPISEGPSLVRTDRSDDWSAHHHRAFEKGVKAGLRCVRWAARYKRMGFDVRPHGAATILEVAKRFAGRHGYLQYQGNEGLDIIDFANVHPNVREAFIVGVRHALRAGTQD